jgi:iron complex transport system ATP-binding protein
MALLEIRGLRVAYGDRLVLRGIDLEVEAGEFVGLVGPNGCGKTTLLRAITRVLPWQGGDVRLDGQSAAGLPARALARLVAVVPQNPLLPVGYSAAEVVLMGRTPHLGFFDQEGPDDLRIAREALEQVGAAHLAGRRVDELSGGERQNVVLARALAQQAPVLLLDEPTANLDIGHQIRVAGIMTGLAHEDGLAVVAAIHDLTLASLHCDRLALMHDGLIVANGAPAEVLTSANIRLAYGAGVMLLQQESLPGPVVVPVSPAGD